MNTSILPNDAVDPDAIPVIADYLPATDEGSWRVRRVMVLAMADALIARLDQQEYAPWRPAWIQH